VQRRFTAAAPDRLWGADITYVPTWAGFLDLAVVLDVHSRRVVGWAMADHLRSELVIEAVDMAVWRRRPTEGVIHHSDQGSQYASLAFGRRLRETGLVGSMGSRGDCFDNAAAESFFATLECELLARHRFPTRSAARLALFDYIEGFYNTHRRHSALGYLSPAAFERRWSPQPVVTSQLHVHQTGATPPVPAAQRRRAGPCLVLLQDADDLLLREPAPAHLVLLGASPQLRGLPLSVDRFPGGRSVPLSHW